MRIASALIEKNLPKICCARRVTKHSARPVRDHELKAGKPRQGRKAATAARLSLSWFSDGFFAVVHPGHSRVNRVMRNPAPQLLFILLLSGLFLMREAGREPSSKLESLYVDWLASNSEILTRSAPLTLVEIGDDSIDSGHAWPWSPLDFALFVDAANRLDAGVVAIESILNWGGQKNASPDTAANERILHDRLLKSPKFLAAARLGLPEDPDLVPPPQPVPVVRRVTGNKTKIPEFDIVSRQATDELRLASVTGFTNLIPSPGGRTRSIPLIFRYRGEVVPSFVLQAVALWLKTTPDEIGVYLGSHINIAEKVEIPIDDAGNMVVNFDSRFDRMACDDLLLALSQAEVKQKTVVPIDRARDAIVMLARTDKEARTIEFPTTRKGSLGELFAHAIATIQNHTFVRRAPWLADVLIIAGIMLVANYLGRISRPMMLLTTVLLMTLYLLSSLLVFSKWLIWLPLILPAGLLVITAGYWLIIRPEIRNRA
jgi:CHASE2 domain-containing sensor protein